MLQEKIETPTEQEIKEFFDRVKFKRVKNPLTCNYCNETIEGGSVVIDTGKGKRLHLYPRNCSDIMIVSKIDEKYFKVYKVLYV